MRVVKPSWVEHTGELLVFIRCSENKLTPIGGEKKSKCPVYSMSVHPDGTRLATGGMGRSFSFTVE